MRKQINPGVIFLEKCKWCGEFGVIPNEKNIYRCMKCRKYELTKEDEPVEGIGFESVDLKK